MSDYRMQILHIPTGRLVSWKPGADVEIDMIVDLCERLAKRKIPVSLDPGDDPQFDVVRDLCDRLVKRGVGIFKTEAQVIAAVKEEFSALLYRVGSVRVEDSVLAAIAEEFAALVWDLKSKIR